MPDPAVPLNGSPQRHAGSARVVWTRGGVETTCELDVITAVYVIGRSSRAEVHVDDARVSRRGHAEIYWEGRRWWLRDLGSRNGTYVGTSPITRAVPLVHGNVIRCGATRIGFLWPASICTGETSNRPPTVVAPEAPLLTPTEVDLLRELCRPYTAGQDPRADRQTMPPPNKDLADVLFVSEATVRQRLKRLYPKFGLPGSESGKRIELVARAIETGAIDLVDR